MYTSVLFKPGSLESFDTIGADRFLGSAPRAVNHFTFEKSKPAKPFVSVGVGNVVIDISRTEKLIKEAKALRKSHFWFIWKMASPSKEVIRAAESVIRYCPSELFLNGYQVVNYGNGTVAMIRNNENYLTTINIGAKSLSYAKLRIKDHLLVDSGSCTIEKTAVERLFEVL